MNQNEIYLNEEQCKQFANVIFPDIKDYIEKHKEQYIIWCTANGFDKAA